MVKQKIRTSKGKVLLWIIPSANFSAKLCLAGDKSFRFSIKIHLSERSLWLEQYVAIFATSSGGNVLCDWKFSFFLNSNFYRQIECQCTFLLRK